MRAILILVCWSLSGMLAAAELATLQARIDAGEAGAVVADLVRAAEGGEPLAQRMLAGLYQRGDGVARNLERAAELYSRAAEQGDAEAQFNLGNMYLLGEGVQPDEAWAMTYYRQAARQGHALAKRNLTQLARAAGIEPPHAAAAPGTEPRVSKRPALAPEPLAPPTRLDAQGRVLPADDAASSPPAPLAPRADAAPVVAPGAASAETATAVQDQREALRLAAAHGVVVRFEDGVAPPPHVLAVPRPLPRDAASGAAPASGSVPPVVVPSAPLPGDVVNLLRAAEAGDAEAQYALGERYLLGRGVLPDEAMAITWLRAAARHGHVGAREQLKRIYAEAGLAPPAM